MVICIFKVLQGYRPKDRYYSDLDELNPEAVVDTDTRRQPLAIDSRAVYWEDAAGQSMGTSPGGTYHIHGRSPDDVYDTAFASLVSLQGEHSPISPIPEHRMSTILRVQRLVAKLTTASYSAQIDPEDRRLHRQVSHLRREIANIVLSNSSGVNSLSPLPLPESVILEPPPPYSDAVHNSDDRTAVF
ncbi:hypothetical protein JR316_0010296 [Psilocybe cubensis]|uniref:Uncharacterized protein n=2 Tax=Psilocybe cubensis TaxID=181762 RepID=A0ACB8GR46_PSICU|nr:hypothetical protein JR316_0010296 [Psilocybe cubensis]KAH9478059.1 hypothetical protein JR316_0010296 [Psilocybe cubensis]